jgi:hypothetical protein
MPAPSHAPGACEGDGDALTGGRVGRVSSREILFASRVPTLCNQAEGHIAFITTARWTRTLRGLRPRSRTDASRLGTGRSRGRLGVLQGRIAKSEDTRR